VDSTEQTTIRVLVVDDHLVVAESLAHALIEQPDIDVVGIAGSLAEARAQINAKAPDIVLLDHALPDGEGASAVGPLLADHPGIQIVILTGSVSDAVLVTAMEAGASGFLPKGGGLPELVDAVRSVAAGEIAVHPTLLRRLLQRVHGGDPPSLAHTLTPREKEIFALVAEGLTNPAIAKRLYLSAHTVRNHVARLCAKLGAHSKLEALAIAVRDGLIDPPER
jgi:DNA-binding NarL/FixJ family response regulator